MHQWDYNTPYEVTLRTLDKAVKAGKIRAIGVSNCYSWQLTKMNMLAEMMGLTRFNSVQGHYNLIHREEEKEMIPYCKEDDVALTPYSSLAAGRLCRLPGTETKRANEDTYAMFKYNATAEAYNQIIMRVHELAEKHNCSMTEISLAWILGKVTAPIAGATKKSQIDSMVKAFSIKLSDEENSYLQELYVPHLMANMQSKYGYPVLHAGADLYKIKK